jgi:TonB-dependent receptor
MPHSSDLSSSPFRTREWLRLAVACVTNFAIVAAPCHGFQTLAELPAETPSDDFLVASLLPELAFAELAAPMLDAGGSIAAATSASPRLDWRAPAPARYWRSPEFRPDRPAANRPFWIVAAPPAAELLLVQDSTAGPDSAPWQPGALPAGSDSAPLPGVFGALPLEQEAGNCVIFGEVASGLEPLPGARVEILGTGRIAQTDVQGRFRIEGLPTGDFTAEASALGYSGQTLGVSPNPGTPTELNFNLTAKPTGGDSEEYELEEESVVGEYQENSQGDLFLDLQAGPNIAAGISKEEFASSGISDAAGAVSKIAGANIVGGKYAVVRGLGDRYSNTLVNGALISSADPSKKAVQLDLFPSDLLESVTINKTFTPDKPAEFAGGIVMVETLRFPEQRILELEIGIETNSNLGDTFYENPDGERDFWGDRNDDIPLAPLPEGFLSIGHPGRRPPRTPTEIANAAEAAEQMQAVHGSGGMKPRARNPKEEESFTFTYGDRLKFKNGIEIGGVFAFTREEGDRVREDVQVGRGINFGTDSVPGSDGTPGTEDYVVRTQEEDRYTHYMNWGMLAGAGIKFGKHHEIGMTWFKNKSAEDEVIRGRKIQEVGGLLPPILSTSSSANPFGAAAYMYQAFDSIQPLERELETRQIDGSHRFGEDGEGIRIDWLLARSESLEDRPNSRTLYFTELDFTDPRLASGGDVYNPSLGVVNTAADPSEASPPLVESFRESLKTEEQAGNEGLDLTIPLWKTSDDSFFDFKIGGNHFDREREVRGRLFTYNVSGTLNSTLLGNGGQNGVDYLNGVDSLDPFGNPRFLGWTGPQASSQSNHLILTESTLLGRTVRNVDAGNEISAAYLMGNGEVAGWGFTGGVRLENEDRYYQVVPGLNPTAFVNDAPVHTKNSYALPGFTLWRNFGDEDQMKATVAWSRTIARPTFYEYAPVEIEDQSTGDVIIGNPNLTDTLISNFDLRFDWTPTAETRLSANLFHKAMTDPIAQAYALEKKTWVNGEQGTLQGIEFELSQVIGGGFDFSTNYTYIDSLLQYRQQINSSGQSQLVNSSFEGQPEHIFNFLFGYEYADWGLKTSLVYNYTGEFLTGVPATVGSPTIMREAYSSLDLVISKSFELWECDGTVKLKIGNLLDSEDRQVFAPTELVYQSYSPGRSLSLSADFAF